MSEWRPEFGSELMAAWNECDDDFHALFEVSVEYDSGEDYFCWVIADSHCHALVLASEHDGVPLGAEDYELVDEGVVVRVSMMTEEDGKARLVFDEAVSDWRPRVVAAEAWRD